MIAIDSNLLVYAHRSESPWYGPANIVVTEQAEGDAPWAIPWPCIHEFLSVVTHPRIHQPPTPLALALAQVEAWRESPTLVLLSETTAYWSHFRPLVSAAQIVGPRVHDARIAALCLSHGVRELLTADRDFTRFPSLRTRNPLITRNPSS